MKLIQEFKEFALKGNVIDLAVGVIIGAAFNSVVQSLVRDVMMPPLGYITGGLDFSDKVIVLREAHLSASGTEIPRTAIAYGSFINALITFLVQAVAIFLVVKAINAARRQKEEEVAKEPTSPTLTTQEQLLTEIRDLLRQEDLPPTSSSGSSGLSGG